MRVISQDGYTDIPYEDFVFSATDDWKIKVAKDVVYTTGQGKLRVIAEYSSREKVLKVMELLREAYLKFAHATNDDSFYTFFDNPKVFQFPADDEVKV
jgi:hypothetical protein